MSKTKGHKGKKAHHRGYEALNALKREKRMKIDKELDVALEGTFPASDATAKY
jgi:hypothetical protein